MPERCQECKRPVVEPEGPTTADFVVIAQNPGQVEYRLRRPLVGPSGRLVRTVLSAVGLKFSTEFHLPREALNGADGDVYFTNASWCDCPPDPLRVREELLQLSDRQVILALGREAWMAVSGSGQGIRSVAGKIIWEDNLGCWIVPALHPAAILRADFSVVQDLYITFCDHVNRAVRVLQKGVPPEPPLELIIVEDAAAMRKVMLKILARKRAAFDVELSGYSWYSDRLGIVSLSWSVGEAAVLTPRGLSDPGVRRLLKRLFSDRRIRWIGHNAIFDQRACRFQLGFAPEVRDDTMLMEYCLDERPSQGHLGLKDLCMREFLDTNWQAPLLADLEARGTKNFLVADPKVLYRYAGRDAERTLALAENLGRRVEREGLTKAYNLVIQAQNIFADLDCRGVYFDVEYARRLDKELAHEVEEIRRKATRFAQAHGWQGDLNPGSTKQLRDLIFGLLGCPVILQTPKGAPSTNEETLLTLKKRFPEFAIWDHILQFRRANKLRGTYVKPYVEQWARKHPARQDLYVLYPDTSLTSTETGRLSTRKRRSPAIMTFPREPWMRRMFVAGPPYYDIHANDCWLFSLDYSQLEFRLFAWFAQDPYALEQMRNGLSFHKMAAKAIWGENFTKEQYTRTKNYNFGWLYSGGNWKAGLSSGMNVTEAQRIARMYAERMPKLVQWFREVGEELREKRYLETPFGRRRRFPLILSETHLRELNKEGVNFLCQSTASDVTLSALIRAYHELDQSERLALAFMMHDAIIGYVKLEQLESLLDLWDVMESTGNELTGGDPPITVELSVGRNWGDLEEFSTRDGFLNFIKEV